MQQQHVTRRTSHVTRRTHTSHVTRHNIDSKFNAKGAAPEMLEGGGEGGDWVTRELLRRERSGHHRQ